VRIPEQPPHDLFMADVAALICATDVRTPQLYVVGQAQLGEFVELPGGHGDRRVTNHDGVEGTIRISQRVQEGAVLAADVSTLQADRCWCRRT
jgi:hypothetical protein